MFWESTEKFVNKLWVDFASVPSFDLFVEEALFKLGGLTPNFSRPLNPTSSGDFESVPSSIGGPGGQMGQTSQERRNFFLSFLNQQPYFLVLDNLESLLNESGEWLNSDYGEFFQEWRARGRSSTILVTTRERPPGWQEFVVWLPTLTGFSLEEGTDFLTKEGLVGSQDEKGNLVQCLDGHPLSLRLAASFLRAYYQGQIIEAGELQLATLGKEAKGLHRGNKNAQLFLLLQQHLKRLTEQQQEFLLNLSVYRVAITPENATAMLSGEDNSDLVVRKSLRHLADRSLLNEGETGGYEIHPLIAQYLHLQAEENLLVAAYQKAIDFYQQSLEIKREIGDRRGEASSLTALGNVYQSLGKYQRAIDFYQQSLEIKREIGDGSANLTVRREEANTLQNLANLYHRVGRFKEGFQAGYQAKLILQELGFPLDPSPLPKWAKSVAKFAQKGNLQLAFCFLAGLIAFPFALIWIVSLILWRILRSLFRR